MSANDDYLGAEGLGGALGGEPRRRRRRGTLTGTASNQPVMSDVAKLAGVSSQTVSRVLNNDAYVAPDTRDRVLAAVRALGYRRNPAARALATGRSQTIGVAAFDTTFYGSAATLAGIERAADATGYAVTIVSLRALDRAALEAAFERLQRHSVDGVLVIAPLTRVFSTLADLAAQMPLVAVESGPQTGLPVVGVDQHAGAVLAVRHLLELGHETVWHLAGPPESEAAGQRQTAWRETLDGAGCSVPEPITGDWTARSGYDGARELLRRTASGAVFAANDQMALGALRAMQEAGRAIPRDFSVVGFDDIPEAAYLTPPLTTVQQDFTEVGRRALELLVGRIADPAAPALAELVQPTLLVRGTTVAPA